MLAPGSVNPKDGSAVPKGDGYELTGHWRFGTGIVHADWVLLSGAHRDRARRPAAHVPGAARRRRGARHVARRRHGRDRQPRHRRERACSSRSARSRCARRSPARRARTPGYLARLPVAPMLSLTAAIPSLGAARRAVELFRGLVARARSVRHEQAAEPARGRADPPRHRARRRARGRDGAARRRARGDRARARRAAALVPRSDPDAPHDRPRRPRLPDASCGT